MTKLNFTKASIFIYSHFLNILKIISRLTGIRSYVTELEINNLKSHNV